MSPPMQRKSVGRLQDPDPTGLLVCLKEFCRRKINVLSIKILLPSGKIASNAKLVCPGEALASMELRQEIDGRGSETAFCLYWRIHFFMEVE